MAFLLFFGILPYISIIININYSLPVYNSNYTIILGFPLCVLGMIVILHSLSSLFFKPKQEFSTSAGVTEKLIISGLYRYVRNPIFIGYFIVILSEFFIFGYILILAYLLIVIIFTNISVIYKEEKILEKKFGSDYINYKKKVPR